MGTRTNIGPAIRDAIDREVFWAVDFEVVGEQEREVLDKIVEAATEAVHEVLREYGVVTD